MQVIASLLVLVTLTFGCAQPQAVFYPDLDNPRYTRVNFRTNGTKIFSSNILERPNAIPVGSPVVVTMFSDLQVNMTVHGALYTMHPLFVGRFDTNEQSIARFLDKYFVDSEEELKLDSTEPESLREQIKAGAYSLGMTKEQLYTSLGPPTNIDGSLQTANLSRQQIMRSDRWSYSDEWWIVAPTAKDFVFFDGKLQNIIPP